MSLEEYRQRQHRAYLQRQRERDLSEKREENTASPSIGIRSSSISEAFKQCITYNGPGQLEGTTCEQLSTLENIWTDDNSRNPVCNSSSSHSSSYSSSSSSGSSLFFKRNKVDLNEQKVPRSSQPKPLGGKGQKSLSSSKRLSMQSTPTISSPLEVCEDTSCDAMLAKLLSSDLEDEAKTQNQGNTEIDEASAAAIARLIASDSDGTEKLSSDADGVRVPDAVFQECLISDYRSPPRDRLSTETARKSAETSTHKTSERLLNCLYFELVRLCWVVFKLPMDFRRLSTICDASEQGNLCFVEVKHVPCSLSYLIAVICPCISLADGPISDHEIARRLQEEEFLKEDPLVSQR